MAKIKVYNIFGVGHCRSEASSFLIIYKNGKIKKGDRGLSTWYALQGSTSLIEVPADDKNNIIIVDATSSDFQKITIQGMATWRTSDHMKLAERIDFSLDLKTGKYNSEPLEHITELINGIIKTSIEKYMSKKTIKEILENGIENLLLSVENEVLKNAKLEAMGLEIVNIRLNDLSPSPELVRALRQPTFEIIQQNADEATFSRRAAAVEKEAKIAENETKAKISLANETKKLIEIERENELSKTKTIVEKNQLSADGDYKVKEVSARSLANTQKIAIENDVELKKISSIAEAESTFIRAEAEAKSIKEVETAKIEAEKARAEIAKEIPEIVVLAEAIKEGLSNSNIGTLNLGPDTMNMISETLAKAFVKKGIK